MKTDVFIGVDTSNYTSSVAICDINGNILLNKKVVLPVRDGECGLRQNEAVFNHIKNFESIFGEIENNDYKILAVGFSGSPRDEEGSYMPCFLVGEIIAKAISFSSNTTAFRFSHQAGHIRASVYSSGAVETSEFLAFHVSGGTTEILKVKKINGYYSIMKIGGSIDLHAGQVIDRIGVKMGIGFPCGRELEKLSSENTYPVPKSKICVHGLDCNLSGLENLADNLYKESNDKKLVSDFVINFIGDTLIELSKNLRNQYPDESIIYAGGVMSNSFLQKKINGLFDNVYFAKTEFSSDNASGIALLTRDRYLYKE